MAKDPVLEIDGATRRLRELVAEMERHYEGRGFTKQQIAEKTTLNRHTFWRRLEVDLFSKQQMETMQAIADLMSRPLIDLLPEIDPRTAIAPGKNAADPVSESKQKSQLALALLRSLPHAELRSLLPTLLRLASDNIDLIIPLGGITPSSSSREDTIMCAALLDYYRRVVADAGFDLRTNIKGDRDKFARAIRAKKPGEGTQRLIELAIGEGAPVTEGDFPDIVWAIDCLGGDRAQSENLKEERCVGC